jgi:hypothetical protein
MTQAATILTRTEGLPVALIEPRVSRINFRFELEVQIFFASFGSQSFEIAFGTE